MNSFDIYALVDPRETGFQSVRYIGATKDTRKRLNVHVGFARRGRHGPSYDWIRDILANGLRPKVIRIGRVFTVTERDTLEKQWTDYYRALGAPLANQSSGFGTTGYKHTPEAHEAMSAAKRGKVPIHALAGAIAHNTGRKRSEQERANMSAAVTQRYQDPEKRRATSEAMKAWWAKRKQGPPAD